MAQNIGNPAINFPADTTGVSFIQGLIPALLNMGFVAGSVFFLFNAILGGIKWISAGGDKGHIETARSQVTNSVIGMFVLLSVYVIVGFIELFFGVNLTMFDLESLRITGDGGPIPPGAPPQNPGGPIGV